MTVSILAVVISGILIVGNIKGWFGNEETDQIADMRVEYSKGIVHIERSGVSYSLQPGAFLREGDIIGTLDSAEATISLGSGTKICLNENTKFTVSSLPGKGDKVILDVNSGSIYVDCDTSEEEFSVEFASRDYTMNTDSAVFGQSVYSGVVNITVLSGEINVQSAEKSSSVEAQKTVSFIVKEDGTKETDMSDISPSELDEFLIQKALETAKEKTLCFSEAELKKVSDDRTAEKLAMQENADEIPGGEDDGRKKLYCTVTIRCDTILNNLDSLTDGKEAYVPKDGMIIAPSKVYFYEGETAFDVLKRVCELMEIQLEYSWTPLYNSHYVEGINHLYEFDCGAESGWMYKADGWFPNYGASAYKVKDGDSIVWAYTCKGLGEDVGGSL